MKSMRMTWFSVLVGSILIASGLLANYGSGVPSVGAESSGSPTTQILNKLDQILAALASGSGLVDQCYGGTNVGRFIVNGAEVCDRATGLIWQKSPYVSPRSYAAAVTYCLTPTTTVAAGSRLPEVKELQSLLDYSQAQPALPVGHPFTVNTNSYYWSATTVVGRTDLAWVVDFFYGSTLGNDKSFNNFVWCVRRA